MSLDPTQSDRTTAVENDASRGDVGDEIDIVLDDEHAEPRARSCSRSRAR